mgnify:CR=1 FL=1|tara:strand:- start:795 stop:1097 length:303 start_codon:yes stop_codon:yes gene_type:complete
MAVETFQLEGENLDNVRDLIGKGDALIRYHSKVRTDFLGLEMKIMQERATVEQSMRDTVKKIADELEVSNVISYEVDQESGSLTLTTEEATETEVTTEAE